MRNFKIYWVVFFALFSFQRFARGYEILYPSKPDSQQTWFEDFDTQKDYDQNHHLKKQDKKFKEQEILQYLQKETKTKQPPQKETHKKPTVYK